MKCWDIVSLPTSLLRTASAGCLARKKAIWAPEFLLVAFSINYGWMNGGGMDETVISTS